MIIRNGILESSRSRPASGDYVVATGGTITYDGNFKIHTFTTDGAFEVTKGGDVSVLIVGGGQAGHANFPGTFDYGGGGGGGDVKEYNLTVEALTYNASIGAGGVKQELAGAIGGSGGTSAFHNLSAAGGGPAYSFMNGGNSPNGGTGGTFGTYGGGGGGGNGGNGYSGGSTIPTSGTMSQGGVGTLSTITGEYYGGGGGGGGYHHAPAGGAGGGGNGGKWGYGGADGAANTGGGGGGPAWAFSVVWGGNGGSGIVVIKYKYK